MSILRASEIGISMAVDFACRLPLDIGLAAPRRARGSRRRHAPSMPDPSCGGGGPARLHLGDSCRPEGLSGSSISVGRRPIASRVTDGCVGCETGVFTSTQRQRPLNRLLVPEEHLARRRPPPPERATRSSSRTVGGSFARPQATCCSASGIGSSCGCDCRCSTMNS